jgi:hypothetical protein
VYIFLIHPVEVTIARKVLPHSQGIKGSMHNLLNKGLFIWSRFTRTRFEAELFWCIEISHSARFSKKLHYFLEIDYIYTVLSKSTHEWPRMTTSDHEWPRMTTSDHEWPRMTTSDHEWPRMTTNDHEWPRVISVFESHKTILTNYFKMAP